LFHAFRCSGLYIPVHPGEIRPARDTSVILVKTNPAPRIARLLRCARCQSFGVPSSATYWHIGLTTTRLVSTRSRSLNGVNMGGGAWGVVRGTWDCFSACVAYHSSMLSTNLGSRTFKLSCVMRRLRVSRLN